MEPSRRTPRSQAELPFHYLFTSSGCRLCLVPLLMCKDRGARAQASFLEASLEAHFSVCSMDLMVGEEEVTLADPSALSDSFFQDLSIGVSIRKW